MPELPEVEVVRRGLAERAVGRTITGLEVLDARSLRRQSGGEDRLRAVLLGSRISAVVRRGKFLWLRLADGTTADGPTADGRTTDGAVSDGGVPDGVETGEALMAHLGMSGQLRLTTGETPAPARAASEGPASDPLRHRRVSLWLDDGSRIDLVDQRLFGGLWASPLVPASDGLPAGEGSPDALLPEAAAHVARDLLDPAIDLPEVARRMRTRRAPVKALLLDQALVSGIGNIYADEGLWAARVRDDTPGTALSQRTAHALLRETAAVMRRALAVGGTSFDALYVNVDGRSGYFARSLAAYGKEGEPCPRCGTPIRRRAFAGRSSHFCPRCQRAPRPPRSRPTEGPSR